MELTGECLIPAPIQRTWEALNDPAVLKDCIAGCESLERDGDAAFNAALALRIGPVNARFKGRLQLADVKPPESYTIHFDGQGGVAGFGKGSADVSLAPEGAQTRLSYVARAQVGGKIAQVGSRLVDAAASKVAQDFFQAFETKLAGEAAAAAPAAVVPAPAQARTGIPVWWWVAGAAVVLLAVFILRR